MYYCLGTGASDSTELLCCLDDAAAMCECARVVSGRHGYIQMIVDGFVFKPVILSCQSLTVANVCQQFFLKSPRSLNPKMVPETISINPKTVS